MGPEQGFCPEHTEHVKEMGRASATIERLIDSVVGLKETISEAFSRINTHIFEGEGPGGSRERIRSAEDKIVVLTEALKKEQADREKEIERERVARKAEVSQLQKSAWRVALVCAVIGGLIAKVTPEAFAVLVVILKKVAGI